MSSSNAVGYFRISSEKGGEIACHIPSQCCMVTCLFISAGIKNVLENVQNQMLAPYTNDKSFDQLQVAYAFSVSQLSIFRTMF